ncbi:MAG: GWxTD domain-containing protein [Candidatus Aminicenantes bacterium]|nr:GWxTD domain-containing protein [Candidatus Aminicenantes bacterium]
MKKWIYPVVFLFFFCLIVPVQAFDEEKEEEYKSWVDKDVKLLLSADEEKEFKALETDEEKDEFIVLFWAKRDPSPGTKENEFKEEWYKRIEYVEKNFTSGPRKGMSSDMGRVYMLLGPPAQTKGEAGGMKTESQGGSQLEVPPQNWVYQAMPELGLNEPFRVTFRQYQWGYELDQQTPQTILRAMEVFPKVIQFQADLKEMPSFRFKLDEASFEGKLISDFMTSGEALEQIPIEWSPHFSQAANESTYIYFTFLLDSKSAGLKKDEEITFFGKLESADGQDEEFLKTVRLEKGKADQSLVGFGIPAFSDNYTLFLGVRNQNKEKYSLVKAPLEVPNFWSGGLAISTIILSVDVEQIKQKGKEDQEYNPYVLGQLKATPHLDNVFKSSDNMNVLFQVYNAKQVEGEVSLQIDYFIEAPEGTYRLNSQEIKQKVQENQAISGGTEVPLSPLKPAEYTFKIKIIDKNATKMIEAKAPFIVK